MNSPIFWLVCGDFFNTCNEMLDFQTNEYEVCMQEMILTIGAWDNVRDGTNSIIITTVKDVPIIVTISPGHYATYQPLVTEINSPIQSYGSLNYDEGAKTLEFKREPWDLVLEFEEKFASMMGLTGTQMKLGDKIDMSKFNILGGYMDD